MHQPHRPHVRRLLLVVAISGLAWTVLLVLTGGFEVSLGFTVLRSHAAWRPFAVAVIAALAYAILFRDRLTRDHDALLALARRAAAPVVIAAALAAGTASWAWGTFAASGADSYGYVSQSYMWRSGALRIDQPLGARLAHWPAGVATLAPIGYAAQAGGDHAIVPTYAPGLPLLMAIGSMLAGPCGVFAIVPMFSGLLVWFTYRLGRRLGMPLTGVAAAVLTAASPVVLFQGMWPMTDVPVTALWTAALLIALGDSIGAAAAAGTVGALALLVRPNLVPVTVAFGVYFLFRPGAWHRRLLHAAAFNAPLLPAAIVIAALNTYWYGAPWNSGYGALDSLYSWSRIPENVRGYGHTLLESQTLFVFLFLLLLVLPGRLPRRASLLLGAFVAAIWLSYLPYFHFPEWWQVRFLMPALPIMLLLSTIALKRVAALLPAAWGTLLTASILVFVFLQQHAFAQREQIASGVRAGEHRYIDWARFVDRNLPPNAAIVSMQHSGSLRFYAGRLTVRYDYLDGTLLQRAPEDLRALGYQPYVLIEDWEAPEVRKRLGIGEEAPLPWSIVARMREPAGVTLYDATPSHATSIAVDISTSDTRDCEHPRTVRLR